MNLARLIALVLTGALLAACGTAAPLRTVTQGDELAVYSFTEPGTFEEGGYNDATLRIRDGVYRIDVRQGNGELWWGQWGETYDDVIVEVETTQTTERNENAYGVMCRVRGSVGQPPADAQATEEAIAAEATESATDEATAEATGEATAEATDEMTEAASADATAEATDEATAEATEAVSDDATPEATVAPAFGGGDGYLFLVQGTGAYGIFVARGRALTPLVDWTTSDVVNQGRERNVLRATCVGDFLAFSVNGTQVAQVIDSTYRTGQVGLVASAANRLGVTIEFDNLSVFAGSAQ
jgi:hypothetical protein